MTKRIPGLWVMAVLAGCAQPISPPDAADRGIVELAWDSEQISANLEQGERHDVVATGIWLVAGIPAETVHLSVNDPDGIFADVEIAATGRQTFSVTATVDPGLAIGVHQGVLEVLACRDAACLDPMDIAGLPVTLGIRAVADWSTFQRDAGHRGHVPVTLDPAVFEKAWEWRRGADSEPIGGINPVVTDGGLVYASTDVYFGQGILHALRDADGSEAWKRSFGEVPALNPPAVRNGRAFIATTGHEDTALWSFDSLTGDFLWKAGFAGQWPHVMAPTVEGTEVFNNGGYYGGTVYAFSAPTGEAQWFAVKGDDDMSTPAVDATRVYHYSGNSLEIYDRLTGASIASILDPFGSSSGYSYHAAPVLGNRGNVIAFAGGAFSGRASSNVEQYGQRVFSSFDIEDETFEWATSNAYLTAPALADGMIYAGRNSPMSFDAISEATGQVLWSWAPSGQGDVEFHRNVVVTNNLAFVSTDRAVYAVDLVTRQAVWRHDQPGMLALSATGMLYIATGARESDGRLVAIKVR
jgi:outer membrane protein assembly factor BamB